MSQPPQDELRPTIPRSIGCRICMSTAHLTERLGEAESVQTLNLQPHGTVSYGVYRCDEGHVTHAAFDSADGSLRIHEPEDQPTDS